MASYDHLVKDSKGTVYNIPANVAYSTPDQLAADLGVKSNQIQWGNIRTDANFKLPSTPVITPEQLVPAKPVVLPSVTTNTSQPDATVAGATQASKTYKDYEKQFTPDQTEEQKKTAVITSRIDELLGQTAGQQKAVLEEENRLGVETMKKELAQYNADLTKQLAEYNAKKTEYEKLLTDAEGKMGTMAALRGEQSRIARERAADLNLAASKIELTQALALGKQGMVEQAQDAAKRAVDLRYAPIMEELQIKSNQLKALQDSGILDRQDKIQAAALEAKYNDEQKAIEEKKTKESGNLNLAVTLGIGTQFANRNGEWFNARTGKTYETPEDFFKDAGVSSFQEAYNRGLVSDVSPNLVADYEEVNKLKAKYWDAGITPQDTIETASQKIRKNSKIYAKENKSGGGGGGSGDGTDVDKVKATPDSVRSWLLKNKRANPNLPYYELWGQLADELQGSGINPQNFDKVFWEILHPEGLAGYEAEQKKKNGGDSSGGIKNPFVKR